MFHQIFNYFVRYREKQPRFCNGKVYVLELGHLLCERTIRVRVNLCVQKLWEMSLTTYGRNVSYKYSYPVKVGQLVNFYKPPFRTGLDDFI